MKDILETLQALQNTPVPNLLIIAGFIFLFLAFVGEISTIIRLPKERQMWAGIIGALFLILGIGLFIVPGSQPEPPTDTLVPEPTDTPTPQPTDTPTPEPTNTTVPSTDTLMPTATPGKSYQGVEVNLLTLDYTIIEPLQRRAPEFEALTGAKVNITGVPFEDLYQKILADLATESNNFDVYVFGPQWLADFVITDYLEDLTSRVATDEAIQWEDISPFFRDFSATYGSRIYTIPLDGDFLMVYYRTDLLEQKGLEPPETWEEYLNIASTFYGKDLNGDGDPDYGSCISKGQGMVYWMVWSVAGAFLQSQGTSQGSFFNTKTMEPLVNNEAFATALDTFKETAKYGPPDELDLYVTDTRDLFTSGRCALSIDWPDIGTQAIDSKVHGKVGTAILPGSVQVLDRATGRLVNCDAVTCPYALNGVNHAPYAAFGGWAGGINAAANPKTKDAAYDFLSYMSQPAQANVDVTNGNTGYNPYRTSQFQNSQLWIAAGMSPTTISSYLDATKASLEHPNMTLDLRIPQNQRYQQVVLDAAVSQFLAGEITRDEAMQQIYDGWERITEDTGRVSQLNAYHDSLNIIR